MEGLVRRRSSITQGHATIGILILVIAPLFVQSRFDSSFSDDFNSGTLDPLKWLIGTNYCNQTAAANNALELRSSCAESGWIITRNAHPARHTIVSIKVVQPNEDGDLGISPTYAPSSKYGIYSEANWYRFYTLRNEHSGAYHLYVESKKNGTLNGFDVTGNFVIEGAVYLRLRFDNANIHFEASLDGVTWTDAYNETFGLPGYTLDTPFYYELAGYNTALKGVLIVDNFSLTSQSDGDTSAPQISAVTAQNLTSNSAQILWQTDKPADSQVEYGLTTNYSSLTPVDANFVTSHSLLLTGLAANATYHYRVKSKGAGGNLAVSADFVFTTLPVSTLKVTSPNGGEWWFVGDTKPIAWSGASSITNVKLEFSRDAGVSWSTIVASTPNNGVYNWQAPEPISNSCLIRVADAANPSVADVSDGKFYITLNALVNFDPSGQNPVLRPGPPGSWDENIRERGWFMYENGTYHVWYGGWQGGYNFSSPRLVKLGYAYSTDGVNWTKYSGNPIYTQDWIEDVAIVNDGGTYYMYAEDEYTGDGDGAFINLYTSTDKINWTKYGTVIAPTGSGWEAHDVGTPTAWKEGNTWYMLYEGLGNGVAGQVGLASSSDGKNWTRHPNNPVLSHPSGANLDIAIDSIIKINGVYCAYGHYDTGGHNWAGGMFVSTDLLTWTAYSGNPLPYNSPVIVDNGVNYFMYSLISGTNGFAPYNLATSTHTITPPVDTTPPIISAVAASNVTSTAATCVWQTNEAADSQVEYGLTTSYGFSSPLNPALVASHGVTVSGLQARTTYHYRVKSKDAAGNLAVSGDFTFTTSAPSNANFADDFNAGVIDSSKWLVGANYGNQAAVVNNALELRSIAAMNSWIITKNNYNARNTTVTVNVIRPSGDGDLGISPTYSLSSQYGLFNEANWYRFYTYRNGSSGAYRLYVQWKKNGVLNGFDVTGNLAITSAVYLRLRFDDTNIHFEASLDGMTWTDAYNEAFALPGYTLDSAFYYELAGYNTVSAGVFIVDDFSITSGSAGRFAAQPKGNGLAITQMPATFALQNYPNPFTTATRISLSLPQEAEIDLALFDLTGREVKTLAAQSLLTGNYVAIWDGRNHRGEELRSGTYFLRLRYRTETSNRWSQIVRRVLLVK